MNYSKKLYYIIVVIGCFVAIYAQAEEEQNVFILVLGIALLMFGLFKISLSIPSKKNIEDDSEN